MPTGTRISRAPRSPSSSTARRSSPATPAPAGPSNIRRWIIENDWLDSIVALPDQLFYNTGIFTYVWLVTNRKPPERRGKVQLIDGTRFFQKMKKSLNNKRNEISEEQIRFLTRVYGNYRDGETAEVQINGQTETRVISRIFENREFGFLKVTVERPLRMNFQATPERIAKLDDQTAFANLAVSKKRKDQAQVEREEEQGRKQQDTIRALLATLEGNGRYTDRAAFDADLTQAAKRARLPDGQAGLKLPAPLKKAVFAALGERDPDAEICRDAKGRPEPDSELRDTENIPLPPGTALPLPMDFGPDKPNDRLVAAFRDEIDAYIAREVLPHVPDLPASPPASGEYCIYVLQCADGSLYKGQTDDFPKRFKEHRSGKVSWTAKHLPVAPIHWEVFDSREKAVAREQYLKTGKGRAWLQHQLARKELASFKRQAGAWVDYDKTKVGYEIPINRHFYVYKPPRPLDEIEADIARLEGEIAGLLKGLIA